MSIDDRYRAKLQSAIAALQYWAPAVGEAAKISETDGGDYWRIAVDPYVEGGCPFELVLRTDGFHDLMIAGEAYEDQTTDDFEIFVPIARSIADGRVVRRTHVTEDTNSPVAIETLIYLDGGKMWKRQRALVGDSAGERFSTALFEDRHFVPYQR